MKSALLSCVFALLLPFQLFSQADASVKLLAGGAIELGGDRTGWFTNEAGETRVIRGAQGVSVAAGLQFRPKAWNRFMMHATVGYKYWRAFTPGAHVRMTRVPLHLTAHYWLNDNFRLGLGVLTDRSIRFRGDGLATDHDYDPSFGTKAEIGWRNLALGYTRMRYYGATDRDRCAGGLGLTYLFTL